MTYLFTVFFATVYFLISFIIPIHNTGQLFNILDTPYDKSRVKYQYASGGGDLALSYIQVSPKVVSEVLQKDVSIFKHCLEGHFCTGSWVSKDDLQRDYSKVPVDSKETDELYRVTMTDSTRCQYQALVRGGYVKMKDITCVNSESGMSAYIKLRT